MIIHVCGCGLYLGVVMCVYVHVLVHAHNLFYLFQVKLICTANGSSGELFLQPDNEVGGASSDE